MACAIVFVACGAYIADYYMKSNTAQSSLENIAGSSSDLAELYEENRDLVGWIKVDGTAIDYPVMQSTEEPQRYLRKGFDREYSLAGTPFLAAESTIGSEDVGGASSSLNWLIYGHNMKSGTMFHDLLKYEDREFCEKHPTFTFSHIVRNRAGYPKRDASGNVQFTEPEEYVIVACAYSQIYDKKDTCFKYYNYGLITSPEQLREYLDGVSQIAEYEIKPLQSADGRFVTLSTCAYHVEDGRFFIVGMRSRETL